MYYNETNFRAALYGIRRLSKMTARQSRQFVIIIIALAAVFLAQLIFYPQAALAASPLTRGIDIVVELDNDGGGYVTEVWDVRTVDGTEFFLTKYYLQDQEITGLSVRDESGRDYRNIGAWDSQRPLKEKDGECGLISINGGYEICWGIGANYGDHIYTVRYHMNNLVKGCNDYDILYQQFVSSDLLAPVQRVGLTVKPPDLVFTTENTGVWGFGHSGDIRVTDSLVVSKSQQSLAKADHVTVLLRFDKGMFNPQLQLDMDFEDVRTEAFAGSNYASGNQQAQPTSTVMMVIGNILSLLIPIGIVFLVIYSRKSHSARHKLSNRTITRKIYKELPYCREIPFNGSLAATYNRYRESAGAPDKIGDLAGAFILKWLNEGKAQVVSQSSMLKKEQTALQLLDDEAGRTAWKSMPCTSAVEIEQALYGMFLSAAGADQVLESKEMKRWSESHYDEIDKWLKKLKTVAHTELTDMGCAALTEVKGTFGKTHKLLKLTPYGEEMTDRMHGFKKFLTEFTIIDERDPDEVKLWHNYLIYAKVLGIASQVTRRIAKLCPALLQNPEFNNSAIDISNIFAISMHSGYVSGRYDSSDGGGGGFSGGGGGGIYSCRSTSFIIPAASCSSCTAVSTRNATNKSSTM